MIRSVSREAVALAIFDKLKSIEGITTLGRKHVLPAADQQPALFQVDTNNNEGQKANTPGKLQMSFMLFLYVWDTNGDEPLGQETALVETAIHNFLDAIDKALDPGPAFDKQTLGGLVEHCWIQGDESMDPGVFGKQGFAVVPVNVLIP